MVLALHASEVVEIGGIGIHVFTLSSSNAVVIQRIRVYSEAWVVLEGNLCLFSFTSHVFIHVSALNEPKPSRARLLSL